MILDDAVEARSANSDSWRTHGGLYSILSVSEDSVSRTPDSYMATPTLGYYLASADRCLPGTQQDWMEYAGNKPGYKW